MRVPIKNTKLPAGHEWVDMEMVQLHSLLAYLFDEVGIDIPPQQVSAFWEHHEAVGSPWMSECNGISHDTLPLGIFGDGARARQQAFRPAEKIVGIFANLPLFRPRSARQSRFLLFCIDESLLYGRQTLNCIYRRIVWEINLLRDGMSPAGTKATKQGLKFALVEHRGDWSFFKQLFGFNSSWIGGANCSVCFLCEAYARGPCNNQYYHVGRQAHCWATEYDRVGFIARQMPDRDICYLQCIGQSV